MFQCREIEDGEGIRFEEATLRSNPAAIFKGMMDSRAQADQIVERWYKKVGAEGGCLFRYQPPSIQLAPIPGPGGLMTYSVKAVCPELWLFPEFDLSRGFPMLKEIGFLEAWDRKKAEKVGDFVGKLLSEFRGLTPAAMGRDYLVLYSLSEGLVSEDLARAVSAFNRDVCGVVKPDGELRDEIKNASRKDCITIGKL